MANLCDRTCWRSLAASVTTEAWRHSSPSRDRTKASGFRSRGMPRSSAGSRTWGFSSNRWPSAVSTLRVLCHNGGYYLEDLNSSNGTYLNSQRVNGRVPLSARDSLQIGPYVLALQPDPSASLSETQSIVRGASMSPRPTRRSTPRIPATSSRSFSKSPATSVGHSIRMRCSANCSTSFSGCSRKPTAAWCCSVTATITSSVLRKRAAKARTPSSTTAGPSSRRRWTRGLACSAKTSAPIRASTSPVR